VVGFYWGPPAGIRLGAGIAIGFGVGIGIGLFAHYGWGFHAWEPNWRGGVVVYNHTTYISRSVTVINRGHFGGYNRGVFEHAGRGVPGGFQPAVTARTAVFAHPGPAAERGPTPRPGPEMNRPEPQAARAPEGGSPRQANRPAPQVARGPEARQAHPQANASRQPARPPANAEPRPQAKSQPLARRGEPKAPPPKKEEGRK